MIILGIEEKQDTMMMFDSSRRLGFDRDSSLNHVR